MKVAVFHTLVPRYGKQGINLTAGIAEYTLTEEEKKLVAAGRFDLVATAAQRGIQPAQKEPAPIRLPREHRYVGQRPKGKAAAMLTLEVLEAAQAAGKSQAELAAELDVTPTTVSLAAKKHGVIWKRKKTTHRGKRP